MFSKVHPRKISISTERGSAEVQEHRNESEDNKAESSSKRESE